ncbi:S9 family peptidase [Arthrobacter sp. USHLN218]|uniref:S9 family peptidase n=1 Tax=Arthrobacter sp. USHLN218 TaxID=3081232 RepID=UPI00301A1E70
MTSETTLSDQGGEAGAPAASASTRPRSSFHDLDHYIALPRLSSLALSPDGSRLITAVSVLNGKSTEYSTALWEVDPAGSRPARRVTRSAKGEASPAFLPSGDLLFTSARPAPESEGDEPVAALWKLPAGGGEARQLVSRPGGINSVLTARSAEVAVVNADVLPGAADEEDEARLRKLRKDKQISAILHSGYPVRFWDHDLGPGSPSQFVLEQREMEPVLPTTVEAEGEYSLRGITPGAGAQLVESTAALSPDGRTLLTSWREPLAKGDMREALAAVDTAGGGVRVLLSSEDVDYRPGPVSPDGRTVVVACEKVSGPQAIPDTTLGLLPLGGGDLLPLAAGWDRWPEPAQWLPDASALLVTADEDGARPLFLIDAGTGSVRRVTADAAAYTDVVVSPDGLYAYALRSSYLFPPEPVRIELATGVTTVLPGPALRPQLPGRLEEIETTTAEGGLSVRVRGWLVLPEGASEENPAPLLLWIHGGPLHSWNAWSWRWCPWLLAAQGYAVLLPDPALSTGYGKDFIRRGWGQWGQAPFTDLMSLTDEAVGRPDIDQDRTAALGGSFGGYMANWVAGHTDRFRAIVTHASLWALDQFGPTTDASFYWEKEMTPEMALENSPHLHVGKISTPMLVVHGDKDYRVPIGEGLRLWYELLSKSALPQREDGTTDHRFLYFPDENHWVLKPQHVKVWYQVVQEFLARHVLEGEAELPAELGL